MKKWTLIIGGGLMVLVMTFSTVKRVYPLAWGVHSQINQPMLSNLAVNGADVVSYFLEQKFIAGEEKYAYRWNDATWYFVSEENKARFAASPEKYLPEFGGYCSFAVSKGFTANSDPSQFEFVDGKLYLFADANVQADWMNDQVNNLKMSQANW